MKIGCAAWCFAAPHYQAPYEKAITTIGQMGFDTIEMIAFNQDDVEYYYTKEKTAELKSLIASYGMTVSQFAVYTELTEKLASLDKDERAEGLRYFETLVQIGYQLGAPMINMVSNWTYRQTCQVTYISNYWAPFTGGASKRELTQNMQLPEDYNGNAEWNQYMDTLEQCLNICRKYEMAFNIEGHANVIVGTTDAMLRMFDNIAEPDLGINFDIAWHLLQREYVPMSIRKLGTRIFHIHLRDGDGILNYDLPPGYGIVNWKDTIKALKETGFDGALSFEMTNYMEPEKVLKAAKEYIETIISEV